MSLETHIKDLKRCHLLCNFGNRGDGIIEQGCKQMLTRLGIKYHVIPQGYSAIGETLLVLGNGAFCNSWHHKPAQVEFFYDKFDQIIVLPATYDLSCQEVFLWAKFMPKKVKAFCRDEESFRQMSAITKNVYLDHDLAFHFDFTKYKKQGSGVLCAWRTDTERAKHPVIPCDLEEDVSKGRVGDWLTLIEKVAEFNVIHTDRLHTGIVGAMLDKEVHLYANNYFKVKAVYDYSLVNKPNVIWEG